MRVPATGSAPRVSVVIPTFNSVSYLAETVASVRAQTLVEWELVIVDDGSSDDSAALAERLAASDRRIRVEAGPHRGVAGARNRGIEQTDPRAPYIALLDSDDTWEPDALAVLTEALSAESDRPAAYALARAIDARGHQIPGDDLAWSMRHRGEWRREGVVEVPASAPTSFAAMLLKNCPVTPGTTIYRREALRTVGRFEPSTTPADDWDMNLRVSRRGGLALVDRVVLNWRRHPTSLSLSSKRWRQAYLAVRRRTVEAAENTSEEREAATEVLRADCRESLTALRQSLTGGSPTVSARAAVRALLTHRAYLLTRL